MTENGPEYEDVEIPDALFDRMYICLLYTSFVNGIIILMMAVMIFTLCMYVPVFRKMKQEDDC